LKLQYKDFSGWQNRLFQQGGAAAQEDYWLKRFESKPTTLNLPVDYPGAGRTSYQGKIRTFQIDSRLTARINDIMSRTETTLYMVLLAAYNVLLFRYTRRDDIVVGSPVTGRRHADLQNILGLFVNMLAMRNRPLAGKTFDRFLEEVKENALNGFENQDYQFDNLVARLGLRGTAGRTPLVETVFTLQSPLDRPGGESSAMHGKTGQTVKPHELDACTVKFDLTVDAVPAGDCINMWITYAVELFKTSTIEKMRDHFIEILDQVTGNPGIKLQEVTVSTGASAAQSGAAAQDSGDFDF
jgi:non-ribosomal peptide synthetase component F